MNNKNDKEFIDFVTENSSNSGLKVPDFFWIALSIMFIMIGFKYGYDTYQEHRFITALEDGIKIADREIRKQNRINRKIINQMTESTQKFNEEMLQNTKRMHENMRKLHNSRMQSNQD